MLESLRWRWRRHLVQFGNRRIAEVVHMPNGMAAVFDQRGQQMPEFQGRSELMRPLIAAHRRHYRWGDRQRAPWPCR